MNFLAEKTLRRQYLSIYLMVLVVSSIGSVVALHSNYSSYVREAKNELQREAHTTNIQVEAVLVDAEKILDIALPKFIESIDSGKFTDDAAYQILNNTRKVFSSFVANESFMLTLYIDQDGEVHASNRGVSKAKINLSERLYFQTLKENPKLRFAVGNLVMAKTTGLLTFHIAAPIIDKAGQFRGIIAQQMLANDFAVNLKNSLNELVPAQILVHLKGGNVTFMYPYPVTQNEIDSDRHTYAYESMITDGHDSNVIVLPASAASANASYVGYAKSHNYDLVTTATYPKSAILAGFLNASWVVIAYCLLAIALLTFGFWRFYEHALNMNATLMMSFTDGLTKLKNRRAFDVEFPVLWKDAMRSKKPISVLFIDIDHFKIFNDDYGHECGDIALIAVARTISRCVTRPLDLCCRWGGEEFAVVLPDTDERGAILLANEILVAMRSVTLDFPCEKRPNITVSIGIATAIVTNKNKTDDLVDMADKAMYNAKQSGRDRYALYGAKNTVSQ